MAKTTWSRVYRDLVRATESLGADILFFRGHCRAPWKLLPSIARFKPKEGRRTESIVYFDFVTRAGDLLPVSPSSWSVLFAMRHHGLPTRLLDWTETMAVAIYFAIRDARGDSAVWILDPFALNEHTLNRAALLRPSDLEISYDDLVSGTGTLLAPAVAVSPVRHHPRVNRQRSGFTLHGDVETPLEKIAPKAVKRVVIPRETHDDARVFLKHVGITEFSLFPDLDGLARELRDEHYRGAPEGRERQHSPR